MIPRAAALAVAVVAGSCATAAAQGLAAVELYLDGRRDEAVAALANDSEGWRAAEIESLKAIKELPDARSGALLRAAVLLHGDRAALERARQAAPGGRRCGRNDQDAMAQSVATLLLARKDGRAFVQRWYRAMALASQRELCGADLKIWVEAGLEWFPKDAALELARGTFAETESAFAHTLDFATLDGWHEAFQQDRAKRAQALARTSLARAVKLDPELHEARLRLGRTLLRLGKREDARKHLERVAASGAAPALVYLSHLFLARLHDEAGRTAEADREYVAALAVEPAGQAAALGLAQLRSRQVGLSASREALAGAVARAPRAEARDPYWSYPGAFAGGGEAELAALRAEVTP